MATLYCTRHPGVLSRRLFAVDLHSVAVGLRPLRLGCVLSLGGASCVFVSCLSPLLRSLVLLFTSLHSYPAFHTNLLSLLLFLASPASSSAVLVPLCDTRRCSRDRKPMPNPDIAITIHGPPDASSRPSEDFELVRYPNLQHTDWKSSHRQEELPFYMTEDTSARRRVTHPPQGPTSPQRNPRWDDVVVEGR